MDNQGQFTDNQTTQGAGGASPYGNAAGYGVPPGAVREKKDGQAYGIASLVLGFLALIFFCACINVPLAILSLFFGMVQLAGYKEKLTAVFGIALSAMSLILTIVAIMVFTSVSIDMGSFTTNGPDGGAGSYEEYFEQYFNNLEDGSF